MIAYSACIPIGLASPIAALVLFLVIAVFYAVTSQGWSSATLDAD